jgi:hypothetical protein
MTYKCALVETPFWRLKGELVIHGQDDDEMERITQSFRL